MAGPGGPEKRPECCDRPHQDTQLCDDDGLVRRGAMHKGTDYHCTGHAHFAGWHIICTGPAHRPNDGPIFGARIKGEGYDVQICTDEPLTDEERAALHEFLGSTIGKP